MTRTKRRMITDDGVDVHIVVLVPCGLALLMFLVGILLSSHVWQCFFFGALAVALAGTMAWYVYQCRGGRP